MESAITTTEPEISSKTRKSLPARSLKEIITSQIITLASYVTPVMETDDVEAIHKMRVTTRRLQASLDLLQTRQTKLKVRKIKRELRDWRRVLSEVRNYDVFLLVIEKEGASRSSSRQSFEHLKAILQKRRAKNLAKARRYLKKVRLGEICSKLGLDIDISSTAPAPVDDEQASVAETDTEEKATEEKPLDRPVASRPELTDERAIALRAAERIEQRMIEFEALAAQSQPATNPAELHQLRIAAKRLRYLLEIVSEMGYGDTTRALAWLRLLQDRIGDWHDLEAIEAEIVSIVSRRKFLKENLAESSRMLQAAAHLQSKKKALVGKLFPVKVPRTIAATSRRLVRSLRRNPSSRRPKTQPASG
jgi:CHAD domain-containing protein